MIQKGMVSSVLNGGATVTATPYNGGTVSVPLAVPFFLVGVLPVNTPIVYTVFPDNTGVVLTRMDGHGAGGSGIIAVPEGDAIKIAGPSIVVEPVGDTIAIKTATDTGGSV
jgi:hypothetical protein